MAPQQFHDDLLGPTRPVTIVRNRGGKSESRFMVQAGGDFERELLFLLKDAVSSCDEVECEVFDQPRVIERVAPVVLTSGLALWAAAIVPLSAWRQKLQGGRMPQYYPSVIYHWYKESCTVQDMDQDIVQGPGWAYTPAAFKPFQVGSPKHRKDHDPTKWVDHWKVAGLPDSVRTKTRAQLHLADADFWDAPEIEQAVTKAMRKAFDGIAKVLADSQTLTDSILKVDLPALVWDSAIAGGWWRLGRHNPEQDLPRKTGATYWVLAGLTAKTGRHCFILR